MTDAGLVGREEVLGQPPHGKCLCSARVLLHDGGDEFKGRIVGRCASSPREHVFSFDQKLQVGYPLRERC